MRYLNWNNFHLNRLRLGKLGELLIQEAFLSYGFNVYIPLVDDSCEDLLVTKNTRNFEKNCNYWKIQIKTVNLRDYSYICLPKHKCQPRNNFYIALVVFLNKSTPEIFLIPSIVWLSSNDEKERKIFVSRDYIKKKSKPEWGINLSKKNLEYLRKKYKFVDVVNNL